MKYFVNFSNHPSKDWTEEQLDAAEAYGEVRDYPFPSVDAKAGEEEIRDIADVAVEKILAMNPAAVMCQGEFALTYAVISRLIQKNVPVFAACGKRQVEEIGVGKKIVVFSFENFICYNKLM